MLEEPEPQEVPAEPEALTEAQEADFLILLQEEQLKAGADLPLPEFGSVDRLLPQFMVMGPTHPILH